MFYAILGVIGVTVFIILTYFFIDHYSEDNTDTLARVMILIAVLSVVALLAMIIIGCVAQALGVEL
jgi:hypothetical protein